MTDDMQGVPLTGPDVSQDVSASKRGAPRRRVIYWGLGVALLLALCFVGGLALGYSGAGNSALVSYLMTATPTATNTSLPTATATVITSTPSPIATPTEVFTALPTFTLPPDSGYTDDEFLAVLGSYRVTDTYDFTGDREPGWWNFSDDFGSISMQGGYIRIAVMPEQGLGILGRIPVEIVHDFVVEADFTVAESGSDSEYQLYGFLFRNTGGVLYYAATVTPDGNYVIWSGSEEAMRFIADLEPIPEGVYNDAPGAVNHLAVIAIEDNFGLIVNNVVVANFQDDTNTRGALALFLQTDSRESALVVDVDNIRVGEP